MFLLTLALLLVQDDKKPSPLWERDGEVWIVHADRDRIVLEQEKELVALSSREGRLLWSAPTGRPLRYAGNGVLVTRNAGPGEKIAARKTDTGEKIWEFPVGKRSETHAFAGKILVTGQDSAMSCLETETGKVCWQIPSAPVLRIASDGRCRVFWNDFAGALHAVDLNTGKEEWKAAIGEDARDPMVTDGAYLIVGTKGRMLALDAATGKIAWRGPVARAWKWTARCPFESPFLLMDSPAPFADGVLVASVSESLVGIDPATGKWLWNGHSLGGSLVADGRIFVVDDVEGGLSGLDPHTGKKLWTLEHPEYARAFHALDIDKMQELHYRPHVADNGRLYTSTRREVICQDTGTGKIEWKFKGASRVRRILLVRPFLLVECRDEVELSEGSGILRTKVIRPTLYCLPAENH